MKLTDLLTDNDRAVSPVIGVILMVAITVILAAVIGTFVLGLGDQVQTTAPNTNFATDYDSSDGNLTITHDGGDPVEADELFLRGDVLNEQDESNFAWSNTSNYDPGDDVTAGSDIIVVNESATSSDNVGYFEDQSPDTSTVRVVWEDPESGDSSTLATWEGSNV